MDDFEWVLPRPIRWLLDRGWAWLAGKVLPEMDDALLDIGNVFDEKEAAA